MKQRIISGAFIAVFIVVFGWLGSYPLVALLMVCSIIGYRELTKACKVADGEKENALTITGMVMSALYYAGFMGIQYLRGQDAAALMHSADFFTVTMVACMFLVSMTVYVFTFPKYKAEQVMASFASFVYAPVLMSFVYRGRILPNGIFIYALVFVCSSVCDTCALAAGMTFGKHKMAPVLSPKKTVEGAVGGVIGSAVAAFLTSVIMGMVNPGSGKPLEFVIIGIVGAFISMIGDLGASAIKRNHEIKDYGKLIPGHGGIMDRFDSIIFTAPVIYFLGVLLLGVI